MPPKKTVIVNNLPEVPQAHQSPVGTIKTISSDDCARYRQMLDRVGDHIIGRHIFHLIKSRYKILYVQSSEEIRVRQVFRWLSLAEGFDLFQWDCTRGMLNSHNMQRVQSDSNEIHEDPSAALSYIIDSSKDDEKKRQDKALSLAPGHIFLLFDFHVFLQNGGTPDIQRKLKEFFEISSNCYIVIVAPIFECPPALEKEFTLIDFPYPSKDEIKIALNTLRDEVTAQFPSAVKLTPQKEEDLLQAAAGLTVLEAENAFALSLVKKKEFDVSVVLDEKKQVIRKGGILEYRDSRFTFDEIGGLDVLKEWLRSRRLAFHQDALDYGLSNLKGILLCSSPGCGKSMICDALASEWKMPLLRLDMGAIFSSLVGDSERNLRNVIKLAESVAPAVLFIDEVDKGIAGVQSSGSSDGGVTARVFGTFLTWMQEKTKPVFTICTANNILSLPPEFMRAGRFDEIFYLDLPNEEQRCDVIARILRRKKRDPDNFAISAIASKCDKYSPAEIEKGVNNGMFDAFYDNKREVTTDDIITGMQKFQPLYNSRKEDIEEMRQWAIGKDGVGGSAVLANSPASPKTYGPVRTGRNVDLSPDDF